MSTTLLLDGPNLTMRSLHAGLRGHMSVGDVDTGALTIFINSLSSLLREEAPAYVGIAWESVERSFRYTLHESYKAHRTDAPLLEARDSVFAMVREFCDLAGLLSVSAATLEADDVIAGWWQHAPQGPIVIASDDHDFLQLAGHNPQGVPTTVYRFGTGEHWDDAKVSEHYHSPEHYPLIAALAGDTSDNIPGIRGIGPKKAIKLLEKHDWDLESALDEFPEERENVRTFHTMINLRDVQVITPEPRALPSGGLTPELRQFLEHYKLSGALRKFQQGTFWRGTPYQFVSR